MTCRARAASPRRAASGAPHGSVQRLAAAIRVGCLLTVLLAPIGGAGRAAAEERFLGPEVSIIVSPLYELMPAEGYLPVSVRIENGLDYEGRWRLRFSSSGTASVSGLGRPPIDASLDYVRELSAPANASRTVEVLVPLVGATGTWGASLSLAVSGDGLATRSEVGLVWGRYDPSVPSVAFTERLAESFGAVEPDQDPWQALPIVKVPLGPGFAPSTWRSLVGFQMIWVSDAELLALPQLSKSALSDWILQGGHLVLAGRQEALSDLAIPRAELEASRYGLGAITRIDWTGEALSKADVLRRVSQAYRPVVARDDRIDQRIAPLRIDRVLLALFVVALTTLIGPVNVFYLAKASRVRLLVTTPLIAAGASVVLAAIILIGEGVGGYGERVTVHVVMPEAARELIVQDQSARTGLLVRRGFDVEDDVFLTRYFSQQDPLGSMSFYHEADRRNGDWFRTRGTQAHYLQQIRSTRARVELVGVESDGRPVMISSLPAPLDRLDYHDAEGRVWRAGNVAPGTRAVLDAVAPAPEGELAPESGIRPSIVDDAMAELGWRRGYFYAVAAGARPELAIPTLDSIAWDLDRVLFTGPVTIAAPPQTTQRAQEGHD